MPSSGESSGEYILQAGQQRQLRKPYISPVVSSFRAKRICQPPVKVFNDQQPTSIISPGLDSHTPIYSSSPAHLLLPGTTSRLVHPHHITLVPRYICFTMTTTTPASSTMIDRAQAQKAVDALLKHHEKVSAEREETELIGRDEHVWLVVNTKRGTTKRKLMPKRMYVGLSARSLEAIIADIQPASSPSHAPTTYHDRCHHHETSSTSVQRPHRIPRTQHQIYQPSSRH